MIVGTILKTSGHGGVNVAVSAGVRLRGLVEKVSGTDRGGGSQSDGDDPPSLVVGRANEG